MDLIDRPGGLVSKHCLELGAVGRDDIARNLLAAIVESSDDAIISKTLDGTITSWNAGAQQIFGYTADEAIGMNVTMLFPSGHLDEEPAIIERIRRGERIEHYETKRQHKDGKLLDISLTVSPILDDSGRVVGASKIARDVTLRKRDEAALRTLAQELEQARQALETRVEERTKNLREAVAQMEEFSYTVSHDLRAPLRAMAVHSRVLMDDFREILEKEPEAWRSVQRIAENSQKLDLMIQDVLAYGRVSRGEVKFEQVSLDRLVHDAIEHYPALQPAHARVQVWPLGDVWGHEPSLTQIVSNLLTNAVKFVPPGRIPLVSVRAEHSRGIVKLFVQDNGIGIDPRYQHRLFNMFERIHPELPYEGNGVGLAIVRKAAERMGGRVGMQSDGNTGATFWIELPAASGREAAFQK